MCSAKSGPRAEPAASHADQPGASGVPRRTILVVDDDADFVASVSALLEGRGYSVRTAASGKAGLEQIAAQRPDLVVLDVMMEDPSAGYGVNQALKFSTDGGPRDIPILMVSSIELDPARRFARAEEMPLMVPDEYMTKPLDVPRFLERVAALLEAHERR